mmetsp:Transcript_6305/g.5712  ORF Transcript_6305/g.5712 Transcript_6305/m.5712 type:complete len:299 (-) Transcript_6305:1806-2702(-)
MKPGDHISQSTVDELIDVHINHTNDFHYKVVITCQQSFSKLITIYKARLLPLLDRVIPQLFTNLTEGKDKVYQSTNFFLNIINKLYSGDELFPHFFKSLDFNHKAKYKASLLEFMNIIIRNCKGYFNSNLVIRTAITKYAMIMNDFGANKSIIMPCLGMILYLRDLNHQTTLTAITTLNHEYLQHLRIIASEYAPDLEENIKVFAFHIKGTKYDSQQSPKNSGKIAIPNTAVTSHLEDIKNTALGFGPIDYSAQISKPQRNLSPPLSCNDSEHSRDAHSSKASSKRDIDDVTPQPKPK